MDRKFLIMLLIVIILISGCTVLDFGSVQYFSYDPSARETFTVDYPEWEEIQNQDPVNVITLSRPDRVCTFYLNAPEAPVSWYDEALKNYIEDNGWTIVSEDPLSYIVTSDEGYTFLSKTRSMFCSDKAYFVIFSCLEDNFMDDVFQDIVDSMNCEKNWTVPSRESKKLGMVISPANTTTDYKDFANAFNIARNSGIQITHYYQVWGQVETSEGTRDWIVPDYMMNFIRSKGLEISLVFNIIHTSVVGELPEDLTFTKFDDPELISRFTDFVLEYIERYKDVITYVEIGNEVDIYLNTHPEHLQNFKSLYQQVYGSIKENYPDLPVGTIFAYHDMKNNNAFWVYHNLSIGDFDDFTLYIYNPGFIFNRDPVEIKQHLEEIEALTGDRKFGLEEIGWSTSPRLQGRQQDQVETVKYFFEYLQEAPERLQFMNFFILHDGTYENCIEQAKSFLEPDSPMLENQEFMDIFSDFLCQLGLFRNDGIAKLAWGEWVKQAKDYKEAE